MTTAMSAMDLTLAQRRTLRHLCIERLVMGGMGIGVVVLVSLVVGLAGRQVGVSLLGSIGSLPVIWLALFFRQPLLNPWPLVLLGVRGLQDRGDGQVMDRTIVVRQIQVWGTWDRILIAEDGMRYPLVDGTTPVRVGQAVVITYSPRTRWVWTAEPAERGMV